MKDLDTIFDEINGHGKFQRILLYAVFAPMFGFLPLAWSVQLLLLSVPDHWCYHPMTEGLNATELSQWKQCYLSNGTTNGPYEKCKIYLPSEDEDLFWNQTSFDACPWDKPYVEYDEESRSLPEVKNRSSPCNMSWSFDRSHFKRTLATDLNWVCDDSDRVPEQYMLGQIGILIGSMGLNYLADRFGRKTMLWITLTTLVIPMFAKIFLTQYYYVYTTLNIICYAGVIAVYQIPTSMITEVVDAGYRSWAIMFTWLIWVFGSCVLSFVGWLWGDWFITSLIGVSAMASLFLAYPFVAESPRWLLSRKGRTVEAKVLLNKIAKMNNRPEPENLYKRLNDINEIILNEPKYGVISLFSRWGMAIKTILLVVCMAVNEWIYNQLLINIDNMEGNYYLNLFMMSIIEVPACFIGLWLANNLGRRWTQSGLLFAQSVILALTCTIANHSEEDTASLWGVIGLVLLAKLINSASFMIVYLQAAELYPTSIRTTGMGFVYCVALFLDLPGPYVTDMGKTDKRIPYLVMAGMGLITSISSSFIPETLGCYLAETVEQAARFGSDHKYFSIKISKT